MRRQDNDVARGRLLLCSGGGIRAKIGDDFGERLRPSRIRDDNFVAGVDQVTAERPNVLVTVPAPVKPIVMANLLSRYVADFAGRFQPRTRSSAAITMPTAVVP